LGTYQAVAVALFCSLLSRVRRLWIDWLMGITINRWAHQFPTANHWYEYHMRGGRTYYLFPSVGWYLDNNMWIYFGALVLIFLLSLVYGVRWKRVR
jgi:hypothetical protein